MWQTDPERIKVLDVRTFEEYVLIGHAEMAANVPLAFPTYSWDAGKGNYSVVINADFIAHVKERFAPDDTLLVMCRSGGRSAMAANALAKAGFTQVYNIIDGFDGIRWKTPKASITACACGTAGRTPRHGRTSLIPSWSGCHRKWNWTPSVRPWTFDLDPTKTFRVCETLKIWLGRSSHAHRRLTMTAEQFFSAIAAVAGLTFVVGSMLGTGLSLTVAQILQPLKNARLVILALLTNFVLVPLLAFAITRVIPLDQSLQIGLIVLATTAGAPFLVKEVAAAKGNLSLGVGLMFLLMVVTIFYVPLVLPLLLPGVEVNAWDIAKSLIVTMLLPIILGLMYRSHSPEGAGQWAPLMNKVSGIALLIMLVVGLGLNVSNIISLIGSRGFLALILFVVGSLLIGMLMGGRDPAVRSVLGLATAQRNLAAAVLVTTLNFSGTMTLPFVLVASIILPLILIPTAKRLGGRVPAVASDVPAEPKPESK